MTINVIEIIITTFTKVFSDQVEEKPLPELSQEV